MNKAYISYSMQHANLVPEVETFVKSIGYEPRYWKMGTKYDSTVLKSSDIAIFIINEFNWGTKVEDMTRGIKKELETCIKNKIPVYIAYKRKTDNILGIYDSTYDKTTLVGIGGSKLEPFNDLKYNPCEVIEADTIAESKTIVKIKRKHR